MVKITDDYLNNKKEFTDAGIKVPTYDIKKKMVPQNGFTLVAETCSELFMPQLLIVCLNQATWTPVLLLPKLMIKTS